jgi:hypothetical protein
MALTEKQRRYREKRDSDLQRRSEYLEKKQRKYVEELIVGKRKHVHQLSTRDQRQLRRTWRKNQKSCRMKEKEAQNLLIRPDSPISFQSHQQRSASISRERSKAKCYRENSKLQEQLREERKKKMMYMKRWLREKKKSVKNKAESPRTKTRHLIC